MRSALRRHDPAVSRGATRYRRPTEVLDQVEGQDGVEHRYFHSLSLTGAFAMHQGREHAVGDGESDGLVADQRRHERGLTEDLLVQPR